MNEHNVDRITWTIATIALAAYIVIVSLLS